MQQQGNTAAGGLATGFVFAGLAWFAAQLGESGDVGAVIFGFMAVVTWLKSVRMLWKRERAFLTFEASPREVEDDGGAVWATPEDARDLGLLTGRGLFLGRMNGRDLTYPGDRHLFTVAGTRGGKGASVVVPNLLTIRDRSVIVPDLKPELATMTWERRVELGDECWFINPTQAQGLQPANYNPLAEIEPTDRNIKIHAGNIAASLLPEASAPMGMTVEYFRGAARNYIGWILLFMKCYEPHNCNLVRLRDVAWLPVDELIELLDFCMDNRTVGPLNRLVGQYAGAVRSIVKDAPKQHLGIMGELMNATNEFDGYSMLSDTLRSSDFSMADLRNKHTTVYLMLPTRFIDSYQSYFQLLMSVMIDTVAFNDGPVPALVLWDEFQQCGKVRALNRSFAQLAGHGVQLWPITQDLGEVENTYGKNTLMSMMQNVGPLQIFTPGRDLRRTLSGWTGKRRVILESVGLNFGGGDVPGLNKSRGLYEKGLLQEGHFKALERDKQIILMEGHTIWSHRIKFWEQRAWFNWWKPSPVTPHPKRRKFVGITRKEKRDDPYRY